MQWYRVIIDDPELTKSTSVRSLLACALRHVPSSNVMADRVEVIPGSSELSTWNRSAHMLSVDSLLNSLDSIVQVVWGRFFFFASSNDMNDAARLDLEECIARSSITICVVDNSSYFVFTTSFALVHELLMSYERVEVIKDDLSKIFKGPEDF
jgi:hypothetical protein